MSMIKIERLFFFPPDRYVSLECVWMCEVQENCGISFFIMKHMKCVRLDYSQFQLASLYDGVAFAFVVKGIILKIP